MTTSPSTISVRVPTALRQFSAERAVIPVSVTGATPTVAVVLEELAQTCPGVVDRVLDEQGNLRRHVNVFVDEDDVRTMGGLAAPVSPGAEVSIVPAVSGG